MRTSTLSIRTPEGIVFSQLLAGPVTRFLAWFIDGLCISAILTLLTIALSLLQLLGGGFVVAILIICYFVVSIGYGIFTEWKWRGQTVGKRLRRLRVVGECGARASRRAVPTSKRPN